MCLSLFPGSSDCSVERWSGSRSNINRGALDHSRWWLVSGRIRRVAIFFVVVVVVVSAATCRSINMITKAAVLLSVVVVVVVLVVVAVRCCYFWFRVRSTPVSSCSAPMSSTCMSTKFCCMHICRTRSSRDSLWRFPLPRRRPEQSINAVGPSLRLKPMPSINEEKGSKDQ